MLRVDYADCYGTLVVGPNGAFVHHWSEETKRGVFVCQDIVPVITEEHGPHFGGEGARRRIVAPDNQWYWLTHETHFSSLPEDPSR